MTLSAGARLGPYVASVLVAGQPLRRLLRRWKTEETSEPTSLVLDWTAGLKP